MTGGLIVFLGFFIAIKTLYFKEVPSLIGPGLIILGTGIVVIIAYALVQFTEKIRRAN